MATLPITCGHCGRDVNADIVADVSQSIHQPTYTPRLGVALWLRCPGCGEGSVRKLNSDVIYPGARPGRLLQHLPPDVNQAWDEARSAYSVGAYTAAEIMCRKILMHLAVDKANAQSGKQFIQYVDELENAGYITTGLKPVVDQIRKRGNVANHDLPASSREESLATLKITEHLLEAVYELPGIAAAPPPAAASGSTP
jgi:hypothetical protein